MGLAPESEAFSGNLSHLSVGEDEAANTRQRPDDPHSAGNGNSFATDRARIMQSRAFRRLIHKTHMYLAEDLDDHIPTRLGHTLDVVRIAREIARRVSANEDLVEAIALGHDLGHPPFGHWGELRLHYHASQNQQCGYMPDPSIEPAGGFKHNQQSVYTVDCIESDSPSACGLNLTLWTREGMLKHSSINYGVGASVAILPETVQKELRCDRPYSVSLEGQIVAAADEITEATHAIQDFVQAGAVDYEDVLDTVKGFGAEHRDPGRLLLPHTRAALLARDLESTLMTLCTAHALKEAAGARRVPDGTGVKCLQQEVFPRDLSVCSSMFGKLKEYVAEMMAHCPTLARMDARGAHIIHELFTSYYRNPLLLPDNVWRGYCLMLSPNWYQWPRSAQRPEFLSRLGLQATTPSPDVAAIIRGELRKARRQLEKCQGKCADREGAGPSRDIQAQLWYDPLFVRAIIDHIACMTDVFALREYRKVFAQHGFLRE